MDILVIILLALFIFIVALMAAKLVSLFNIWRKARRYGLSPSPSETLALSRFYELTDEFLLLCRAFKDTSDRVSIQDIVAHHMADGDTASLLNKWKALKAQGQDMSFE